jgi:hypothetical protein
MPLLSALVLLVLLPQGSATVGESDRQESEADAPP